MRAIAIDFETANERRDSACSVGLAWIEDGIVVRRAYRLIRPPEMRFSPGNVRVHGLRPRDVANATSLPEAIAEFMPELTATLILAHNAGFDIGVLRAGLAAHGHAVPRFRYLCTRDVAKAAWPGEESYGLAALAAKIGLAFGHHHAQEDADACARVALAAASHHGTRRIGELMTRLCLTCRSVEGPPLPPRPRTTPNLPGTARASAPPGALAFMVRGSTGSHYEIRGAFAGLGYALRCSCIAGLHRRRCRHVESLLDGEIGDLLSENLHDLNKLRAIVQALGDGAIEPIRLPKAIAA